MEHSPVFSVLLTLPVAPSIAKLGFEVCGDAAFANVKPATSSPSLRNVELAEITEVLALCTAEGCRQGLDKIRVPRQSESVTLLSDLFRIGEQDRFTKQISP